MLCCVVLQPSQPNGIMSSTVNLPNHTFTGQAQSTKRLTSIVHSFARNWQLAFLNQQKGENDCSKNFMIDLHRRMLPTRQGSNPQLSDHHWDAHPNEPPRPSYRVEIKCLTDIDKSLSGLQTVCTPDCISHFCFDREAAVFRAQLFKANDIYIQWYANMLKFFAEKMWVATFFQQKISEYCILNPLKHLTKWLLTSSLS